VIRPRRALPLGLTALVAVVVTVALLALDAPPAAEAQVPPTEDQALAIERQLLCPICTNERLDVCAISICQDMKRIIRERLAAGSTPDEIMLYFEVRYGPKIRAELPAEGFNLWLYGWIVGSILLVSAAGAWFLLDLRRRANAPRPLLAGAPTSEDESWLDAEIAASEDDPEEGER
jgi:cytochrome c-type biogenesis protein CcmH